MNPEELASLTLEHLRAIRATHCLLYTSALPTSDLV